MADSFQPVEVPIKVTADTAQSAQVDAAIDRAKQRADAVMAADEASQAKKLERNLAEIERAKTRADFALEWEEAIQSGGDKESEASNKAAEAVHGHADASKALRQAATAAKEGVWSLQAVMRGDYVTAMHEAKFATVGLNTAIQANPMAIWVAGATLAISALSYFIGESHEAKKAVEETGDAAKAKESDWLILGRATGEAAEQSKLIAERFAAEKKAMEQAREPLAQMTELYKRMRQAQEELLDAETQAKLAEVEHGETSHFYSPEEAKRRRAAIKLGAERSKLDIEQVSVTGPLSESRAAEAAARQRASDAPQDLEKANRAFLEATDRMKKAMPDFEFTAESLRARATALQSAPLNTKGGTEYEDLAAAQAERKEQQDAMSALADADERLAVKRRQNVSAQQEVVRQQQILNEQEAQAAPKLEVLRRKRAALDSAVGTEDARRYQAEVQQQREASDAAHADDAATRTARAERVKEQQESMQKAWEKATPEQRAKALGREVSQLGGRITVENAYGGESRVTGHLVNEAHKASARLKDGGTAGEYAEVISALKTLLEAGQLLKADRAQAMRDLAALKKEAETLKSQISNSRS